MRDATSDAVLNTLTNGAGAGVLDGVIAKVKAKAELKGGTPVDNTLYTTYIDTYLSQVDQLDNTTRAQLGPDYAFIFKYIYPRVYELRKSGSQFGTIVDSLETLVNTGSIDTANIQPQLTINRSITADGQTLSWNSQNAQTISWLSTGPNGNKTGTNLPLNPAPFFTSAAGLYDQGWLAGTYTVVWTVTGNSTTKTFNETFTIPPYTPSASTTTPSGTFTLGQNDVIAIPSGGRYTFDNSKGNVTASWDIQNAEGCWLDPGYVKNGMAYTTKTNGGDFLPAKGNEVIPILAPDGGKFYDIKLVCGKQSTGWANSYGQPTKAFFIDMVTNAVTCTSWTYSAFGTCQSGNTQTRTVTSSSPSGCTGGSPVLSQACTYAEPTCAGTHPPE